MSRDLFPADDEQREHFNRLSEMRGFPVMRHPMRHTMKQIRLGETVHVEGFGEMIVRIEDGKPVLRK
jgi:hypothetical protein